MAGSPPLGWHRADHPGQVVLPFLWAAAMGTAPPAGSGHLGRLYAEIDVDPTALPQFEGWSGWDDIRGMAQDRLPRAGPPLTGPPLTGLLADAICRLSPDPVTHEEWLVSAGRVADARIDAIVSGKHRDAYSRAASLAFAHAEALAGVGRTAQARDYLAAVRARFPRHTAFRGELDAAATTSTLRVKGR